MDGAPDSDKVEKLYNATLRGVLWGDPEEEIMKRLRVNGFSDDVASQMYRRAWRERISAIRSVYWKRIWIGGVALAIGVASYVSLFQLTEGYTVYGKRSSILPGLAVLFGAWKFIDGLTGVLMANSRTGPVSEVDSDID